MDSLWLSRAIVQAPTKLGGFLETTTHGSGRLPRTQSGVYGRSTTLLLEPEGVAEALANRTVALVWSANRCEIGFCGDAASWHSHSRIGSGSRPELFQVEWMTLMLFAEEARP